MVLLVDADSLIWSSCYRTRRQEGDSPFFEDIQEAKDKFDEVLMKIHNDLDEQYSIEDMIVFSGSQGNFRKILDPKYKANRKKSDIPPLLPQIQEYVREQYDSKFAFGIETDDLVAQYWKMISDSIGRENVMIVSIDKDYKQFPCLMYNYHNKHKCVYDISEQEAMFNFYEQMIIGDTADNVNFCKGYGQKFAQKYLADCDSHYKFTKKIYKLFQKIYRGKAKQKYIQCYNLLKLRTK